MSSTSVKGRWKLPRERSETRSSRPVMFSTAFRKKAALSATAWPTRPSPIVPSTIHIGSASISTSATATTSIGAEDCARWAAFSASHAAFSSSSPLSASESAALSPSSGASGSGGPSGKAVSTSPVSLAARTSGCSAGSKAWTTASGSMGPCTSDTGTVPPPFEVVTRGVTAAPPLSVARIWPGEAKFRSVRSAEIESPGRIPLLSIPSHSG